MSNHDEGRYASDLTNRLGVAVVERLVLRKLRWIFRGQDVSDFGIDAHVEVVVTGEPTGRLLALQVKSGPHAFARPSGEGWFYSFDERHARYWRDHALPVVLVLVDVEQERAYWQHLRPDTVVSTGTGWKVWVPRNQTVAEAGPHWDHLASELARTATTSLGASLSHLPPATARHLVQLGQDHQQEAAVLAAHLAEGRRDAANIVNTLMQARPVWLRATGASGLVVLASFAAEHDLRDIGATLLTEAAGLQDERRGHRLATAAHLRLLQDPGAARNLCAQALAADPDEPRAHVTLALLDHGLASLAPLANPPGVDLASARAQGDPVVQAFIVEQARRAGDLDRAVEHATRAATLCHGDSGAATVLADALLRRWQIPQHQDDDLTRARGLLQGAVEERHRWDGDTSEELRVLLQVLLMQQDAAAALQRSTVAPTGTATAEEAARPRVVQLAVAAAAMLGDRKRALRLAENLDNSPASRLLRADVFGEPLEPAEEVHAWQEQLQVAEAEGGVGECTRAVLRLAELGVDASARLAPFVDRGYLPATVREVAYAVALSHHDLSAALPLLRVAAERDTGAAEALVHALGRVGRTEEALQACADAEVRLRQPHLGGLRAHLLDREGRHAQAVTVALEVLGSGQLTGLAAGDMHILVARDAAQRRDWATAENHLASALRTQDPPPPQRVWDLAGVYVMQAQHQPAVALLRRYRPHAHTLQEAKVWLTAWQGHGLDAQAAEEALDLAERFPEDPHLASAVVNEIVMGTRTPEHEEARRDSGDGANTVITAPSSGPEGGGAGTGTVRDPRPLVPGELHRRAFELLEAHLGRHGSASGFYVMRGKPEELTAQTLGMLKERAAQGAEHEANLTDVLGKVQRGQCPTGVLTAALQMPYVAGLLQRVAGVQVAGSWFTDEHDAEMAAAAAAMNQTVVVEPSALVVAEALTAGSVGLRGHFAAVYMAAVSHWEAVAARADARRRSASSATMAWDPVGQRAVYAEVSAAERARLVRRAAAVAAAAESTRALEVDVADIIRLLNQDVSEGPATSASTAEAFGSSVSDETSEGVAEGLDEQAPSLTEADARQHAAWLAPVVLAKAKGWPLWSDDLSVRRLAREHGVAAFGTPALLDALVERRLEALPDLVEPAEVEWVAQAHMEDIAALARDLVVDVPVTVAEVLAQAEADAWRPSLAAVPLARPLWWSQARLGLTGLMDVLVAVADHAPEHVDAWTAAAMRGVLLGYESQPTVAAALLAAVAVVSTTSADGDLRRQGGQNAPAAVDPADLSVHEIPAPSGNDSAGQLGVGDDAAGNHCWRQPARRISQAPPGNLTTPGADNAQADNVLARASSIAAEHGLPNPKLFHEEAVRLVDLLRRLATGDEPAP